MNYKIYFTENEQLYFYNVKTTTNIDIYNLVNELKLENITFNVCSKNQIIVGPHEHFSTQLSSNIVNILHKINYKNIISFEKFRIYDNNCKNIKYDNMLETIYTENISNENKNKTPYKETIDLYNNEDIHYLSTQNIAFDDQELNIYKDLFNKLERNPTFIELYDLSQSNSEHSRHWFFKGQLYVDNILCSYNLFELIKSTLDKTNNSLIAFSDNSSVIKGFNVLSLKNDDNNKVYETNNILDCVLTAETHNFPTLICPFEGASTGIGGRIRDNQATGRGAYINSSLCGYSVGHINIDNLTKNNIENSKFKKPIEILIEASNGASDYGNKFGEPIISGFTNSFGDIIDGNHYEYIKPILFSAGIGTINHNHLHKKMPQENMLIIRIGGPAYKIGLGGGFSSSNTQNSNNLKNEFNAVQRGDPQMENKMNNVIRTCINSENNPILSIHDQGCGGLANVVKEIVYPNGGIVYLEKVTVGDNSLNPLEIWCSEFQESNVLLIEENSLNYLEKLCKRENVCLDNIGVINNSKKIVVKYHDKTLIDLPLDEILHPKIKKQFHLESVKYVDNNNSNYECDNLLGTIKKILSNIDVGSKRFLTNKVDRSVSGLVAAQQTLGPFQIPLCNYSITALGYFDNKGVASCIGQRPIYGIFNNKAQAYNSVCEMVTNMMGAYIKDISNIKCSVNWMWPDKQGVDGYKLLDTANNLCYILKQLNIGIDGGKDSLSMKVTENGKTIKSPGNVVVTGYSPCFDINIGLTPNFKKVHSKIIYVPFLYDYKENINLGATIFSRINKNNYFNNKAQNIDIQKLKRCFNVIQNMISSKLLYSLHDVSDGGLISTIIEMSISSNIGVNLNLNELCKSVDLYKLLFNEDIGIVLEVAEYNIDVFTAIMNKNNIDFETLGNTIQESQFIIDDIIDVKLEELLHAFDKPSFVFENIQGNPNTSLEEHNYLSSEKHIQDFKLNDYLIEFCCSNLNLYKISNKPSIGIIREEGSNGQKEMAAVFHSVGFDCYDILTYDLVKNPSLLQKFKGIAYVGGFSNSDVLGAAHGWYVTIQNNKSLVKQLEIFYNREDTFSLGVCNGCQLMVKQKQLDIFENKCVKLQKNNSNKFESRFVNVKIMNNDSIFFKNMENMVFGIWVAHGEGKFTNCDSLDEKQKVLKYVYNNNPTEKYPFNPNGSQYGIAGIISKNGRHLAMMPHPERCFLKWQLPYLNKYEYIKHSPWLLMFKNMYDFCIN